MHVIENNVLNKRIDTSSFIAHLIWHDGRAADSLASNPRDVKISLDHGLTLLSFEIAMKQWWLDP